MPSYVIGRDQITTAPGVLNDNIKSCTLRVSGNEVDVTTFKATALTQSESMVGLVEITFEITATHTTAEQGDEGAFEIGNLDSAVMQVNAVVTEVKLTTTPRGVDEYTISYAVKPIPS